MIIVSGTIFVQPGTREEYLGRMRSAKITEQARRTDGCRDFVVAADPLEADRVNIYEAWDSVDVLLAFRGDGARDDLDLARLIVQADVHEYEATPCEV